MRKAKKYKEDHMQVESLSDRVTLRIAPEDMQVWKEEAEKEHRALSNWIVWMVKRAQKLEEEKKRDS